MLHPETDMLKALQAGTLPPDQQLTLLSHIAECETCAARFCSLTDPLLNTPPDFEERTISKWRERKKPQRFSILWYSLRVGIAACIALALLYSGVFERFDTKLQLPDNRKLDGITAEMNRFTEKILNWEVAPNDQKTK